MRRIADLPSEIEDRRDHWWRREGTRQIESVYAAERFIEEVGFAFCMTDSRRPGPSLYVAVCGRRDAMMPRNVQSLRHRLPFPPMESAVVSRHSSTSACCIVSGTSRVGELTAAEK